MLPCNKDLNRQHASTEFVYVLRATESAPVAGAPTIYIQTGGGRGRDRASGGGGGRPRKYAGPNLARAGRPPPIDGRPFVSPALGVFYGCFIFAPPSISDFYAFEKCFISISPALPSTRFDRFHVIIYTSTIDCGREIFLNDTNCHVS
ncbi:hypothetical protein EVAR_102226_1 [Eumeta japonica]|uniref:Uncharacterized protein n=1 Tax=Eumeta variegata TaxID=151549 RepID=A0A4C1WDZ8_EUMVA|nr:hypothetical protein EVAR_102226_1 [Eumeta japonica]